MKYVCTYVCIYTGLPFKEKIKPDFLFCTWCCGISERKKMGSEQISRKSEGPLFSWPWDNLGGFKA